MTMSLNNEGHDTMTLIPPTIPTTTARIGVSAQQTRIAAGTKQFIWEIVASASQPVTIDEIVAAYRERHDRSNSTSWYTLYRGTYELCRDKLMFSRSETIDERFATGRYKSGPARLLYWCADADVPARTIDEVLPGVKLSELPTLNPNSKVRYQKTKKRRPAKQSTVQTGQKTFKDVRPAIESFVQTGNRFDRLEKRIAELEKTIESLKTLLD